MRFEAVSWHTWRNNNDGRQQQTARAQSQPAPPRAGNDSARPKEFATQEGISGPMTPPDVELVLQQWINGLRIGHIAHSRTASIFERRNRIMGVSASILSAIVGTSVFAVMANNPKGWQVAVVGTLSVAAAVISALVAFLDYSGRSQRHTSASMLFGHLRRQLELIQTDSSINAVSRRDQMVAVNEAWKELDEEAPQVPSRVHDWARRRVPSAAQQSPPAAGGTFP